MLLQHNKQWLRWVPFFLWVFGIMWSILVQDAAFDVGMSIAIITGPVGLGIPIVGAVICHRPRTRRVYAVGAIAGGAAIMGMAGVLVLAAVLTAVTDGGAAAKAALTAFGETLGMTWPFFVGALMTTVLLMIWSFIDPKPAEKA